MLRKEQGRNAKLFTREKVTKEEQLGPEYQGYGYQATFLGARSTSYQFPKLLTFLKLGAEARHCPSAKRAQNGAPVPGPVV